ncbi:MAG: hypothetical protein ACR5K7_00620 [Symbiopectobacterium sp.]
MKIIGFFSLVGRAYVFKFLWAPIIDRCYISPFLCRPPWMASGQLSVA